MRQTALLPFEARPSGPHFHIDTAFGRRASVFGLVPRGPEKDQMQTILIRNKQDIKNKTIKLLQ
jgi:hypothetical protein